MTDRVLYLTSHPKAVDVEVIYTDSVLFPAVTICNQNLFRFTIYIHCTPTILHYFGNLVDVCPYFHLKTGGTVFPLMHKVEGQTTEKMLS